MKKASFTPFSQKCMEKPPFAEAHQVLFQASQFVGEHPPLYKKNSQCYNIPQIFDKKDPVGKYIRRTPWN